jgi:tetratricopeptide (TPR) repeat protein
MMERFLGSIILLSYMALLLLAAGCDLKRTGREGISSGRSEEPDSADVARSKAVISHRTLGLAYLEENNLEAAEAEFQQLIQLAPQEALGYANLGIVYMRMGRYEEAEENLKRAVEISPDDPDIRLNLAKVYDLVDKEQASREELEKTIEINPDHVQSLYSLAESYQNLTDEYSVSQWEKYLRKIVETAPTNIVARLYLVEVLIRNGQPDEALGNLEEIERISPAYPDEAMQYYRTAMNRLRTDSLSEALTSVRIFHNLIKLTNGYQTDIQKLKGSTASQVGIPVISFSEARPAFLMEGESILDVIRFNDVTVSAGLDVLSGLRSHKIGNMSLTTHIAAGDMDRDGDLDIYVAGYNGESGGPAHYLLLNTMGRFKDIVETAGLKHGGNEYEAIFADYNNDGFLDLYVPGEGPDLLYDNVSEGLFEEVSGKVHITASDPGNRALFFDLDQDGDLDLVQANQKSTLVYRYNGDNTYTDITLNIAFGNPDLGCRDAVFSDFDDDGDVDLFLIDEKGLLQMYFNFREGNFTNATENCGLKNRDNSKRVASGDYNNDGFEDLLVVREGQHPVLFINKGDGTFSMDAANNNLFTKLSAVTGHDALLFDFDNDGYLDVLYVGEPAGSGEKGVFLFHNEGAGKFDDVSTLLPEDLESGTQALVIDYNEDGDMDILMAGKERGIRLLRNDGGNVNHHLKIQLVGIKTGSGKNNHFGIGAKVEMRAGELYQMKTVTSPNIHFGLGDRDKVDVVRVLWTNGVPQNIFSPGSDQDLIEEQELKGSCPFLYTWNGYEYEFLKDIMWRSALGMPLGIMGGTTAYAFADASEEYLKIPGESLKPVKGKYRMQVTAELWETIYFDKIQLFAVDHPGSTGIFLDEKFTGPPFPEFRLYYVQEEHLPRSVTDGTGMDLLDKVREKDFQYIANFRKGKYQGLTGMHDLIIDLGAIDRNKNLTLFLNGWIYPTDASINVAMSQSYNYEVQAPCLQVQDREGAWHTVIENIGFPSGKDPRGGPYR